MKWLEMLKEGTSLRFDYLINSRNEELLNEDERMVYNRKQQLFEKRKAVIVKSNAEAVVTRQMNVSGRHIVHYQLQVEHLVKQQDFFYVEEGIEQRRAVFEKGKLLEDQLLVVKRPQSVEEISSGNAEERVTYKYDRRAAVQYAEKWWNGRNPAYRTFDVDCTNFISQCLRAGGAPMTGYPNRGRGWWYSGNSWSYSWAVAHSLRWYLSGAKQGLQAKEMSSARDLVLGDVICYDFEGDGKWDHNTIVVAKDANDEPLVNAHTNDSRMRYWKYEDSAAWTPNIKYKYFHILSSE
ncbi:amidase domain-containing protein [Bacillus tianshenii]|nr:amidase domain-containing protein [Bacillus tianshenii]